LDVFSLRLFAYYKNWEGISKINSKQQLCNIDAIFPIPVFWVSQNLQKCYVSYSPLHSIGEGSPKIMSAEET